MIHVLFTNLRGDQTVLSAVDEEALWEDMATLVKSRYGSQMGHEAEAKPAAEILNIFGRDYQYIGRFSEPFEVPSPETTYIVTAEEGKERFEQRIGRPPTEREFERVRNHFANGLHETGLWDILDEAIDMTVTE